MDVRCRAGGAPPSSVPPSASQNIVDKTEDNFQMEKEDGGTGYHKSDDTRLTSSSTKSCGGGDHTASQPSPQSFPCLKQISVRVKTRKLWNVPFRFLQIAARELSVLLILIETLILLGGYLIILGVHHSIRYCLRRLRYKGYSSEHSPSHVPLRNHYQQINRPGGVPRRVPRGRMAGG